MKESSEPIWMPVSRREDSLVAASLVDRFATSTGTNSTLDEADTVEPLTLNEEKKRKNMAAEDKQYRLILLAIQGELQDAIYCSKLNLVLFTPTQLLGFFRLHPKLVSTTKHVFEYRRLVPDENSFRRRYLA